MTLQKLLKRLTLLSFASILILTSCESNEGFTSDLSSDDATSVILSDDISNDIDDIVEDDAVDNGLTSKSVEVTNKQPRCGERSVEDTANGKIVTIDFGEGCIGRRGKEFAGKIIIVYVRETTGYSKTVSFEDFTIDDNLVEGSKSISKVNSNANGNPEKTHNVDIQVTFETGEVATKKGVKVKEKVEGADTDDRGDDVYSISGNWESVNKDGEVKAAVITTNLTRTYACRYIVSGVVEITKDGATATLDFGDGSCDNLATLTHADGTSEEITLRRK